MPYYILFPSKDSNQNEILKCQLVIEFQSAWSLKSRGFANIILLQTRVVALSRRSMEASQPDPSPGRLFFYRFFCFLILLVSNDFCFVYVPLMGNFSLLPVFLAFQSAVFPFLCFLECVWVWGGGGGRYNYSLAQVFQYVCCQNN